MKLIDYGVNLDAELTAQLLAGANVRHMSQVPGLTRRISPYDWHVCYKDVSLWFAPEEQITLGPMTAEAEAPEWNTLLLGVAKGEYGYDVMCCDACGDFWYYRPFKTRGALSHWLDHPHSLTY